MPIQWSLDRRIQQPRREPVGWFIVAGPLLGRKAERAASSEVISRKTGSTSSRQRGSCPPQVCRSFQQLPSFLVARAAITATHTNNSLNSITFSAAANCSDLKHLFLSCSRAIFVFQLCLSAPFFLFLSSVDVCAGLLAWLWCCCLSALVCLLDNTHTHTDRASAWNDTCDSTLTRSSFSRPSFLFVEFFARVFVPGITRSSQERERQVSRGFSGFQGLLSPLSAPMFPQFKSYTYDWILANSTSSLIKMYTNFLLDIYVCHFYVDF